MRDCQPWTPWKGTYAEGCEPPLGLEPDDMVLILRRCGQEDGPWPVRLLVWRYRFDPQDIVGYQKRA